MDRWGQALSKVTFEVPYREACSLNSSTDNYCIWTFMPEAIVWYCPIKKKHMYLATKL